MPHRFIAMLFAATLCACAAAPVNKPADAPAPAQVFVDPGDSTQWEPDIVAFEEVDSRVRRRPGGVVFVGSSSIRFWDTLAQDFPGVDTLNRGFGGSRVRDATWYADRIVTPYQPRAVVFYAGDNDLMEGRSVDQVAADFAAFVDKVHAAQPRVRIAFVSIKPSPSRAMLLPQIRQANALVRDYAAAHDDVDYLDVYTPMVNGAGLPRSELFIGDRLHMNAQGYALWATVVRPWLDAL